ncbi:MAG: FadR family transcriptional regulator [Gemmatimonadetes bacterium]|nr:FadR family transcriptional regulator [Gemmatimonadota bacterium]
MMTTPAERLVEAEEGRVREAFRPVAKQSLSDRLARRIRKLIQSGNYQQGDRLPAIMEMARRFGVGHPTVREALKKLEAMGVVEIRHGAGVFVSRSQEVLLLASPDYAGIVTRKLLLDLVQTRIPLEVEAISCAARHATPAHLARMRELLDRAVGNLDDDEQLNTANMGFHREIALASNNSVLAQIVNVLSDLFGDEQRLILDIFGSRAEDHREHVALLEALEARDEALCAELMRKHLEGVRQAIILWNPADHPLSGVAG